MFEQVWCQVVSASYDKVDAKLYGYKRKKVVNETYPAIVPGKEKNFVEGMLYLHVTDKDILKLDTFEGEYYQREISECELPGSKLVQTYVYVFKEEYRKLLADEYWDPERFSKVGIRTFLADYIGFD